MAVVKHTHAVELLVGCDRGDGEEPRLVTSEQCLQPRYARGNVHQERHDMGVE